jgi:hypothetical protein
MEQIFHTNSFSLRSRSFESTCAKPGQLLVK